MPESCLPFLFYAHLLLNVRLGRTWHFASASPLAHLDSIQASSSVCSQASWEPTRPRWSVPFQAANRTGACPSHSSPLQTAPRNLAVKPLPLRCSHSPASTGPSCVPWTSGSRGGTPHTNPAGGWKRTGAAEYQTWSSDVYLLSVQKNWTVYLLYQQTRIVYCIFVCHLKSVGQEAE